jgi:hypothetical protein
MSSGAPHGRLHPTCVVAGAGPTPYQNVTRWAGGENSWEGILKGFLMFLGSLAGSAYMVRAVCDIWLTCFPMLAENCRVSRYTVPTLSAVWRIRHGSGWILSPLSGSGFGKKFFTLKWIILGKSFIMFWRNFVMLILRSTFLYCG